MLEWFIITHCPSVLATLCAIPENVGWMLVGAVGMLCVVIAYDLIRCVVDSRREEEEE